MSSAWYSAAPYGALDSSGYYLEDGSECCLSFGIVEIKVIQTIQQTTMVDILKRL